VTSKTQKNSKKIIFKKFRKILEKIKVNQIFRTYQSNPSKNPTGIHLRKIKGKKGKPKWSPNRRRKKLQQKQWKFFLLPFSIGIPQFLFYYFFGGLLLWNFLLYCGEFL
jgi:hypothetical protein